MKSLPEFLDAKPLYYDEIDYARMPRAYEAIREHLALPRIIHIVGTNGKGTTGRFVANALFKTGFDVGHYTSPHILRFNERIWKNGANCDDATLESAHQKLFTLLGAELSDALSYFEYTTLLAILVYRDCDWVVLEAGLGGEHDATNVFAKELSVFTPISIDHQAFLGDSIESIALTKLRSMGPKALIGFQPHACVYGLFDEIARERGAEALRIQDILDDADMESVEKAALELHLAEYLKQNLLLAAAALKSVGIVPEPGQFEAPALFGRLSRLDSRVTVDVGHNVLAAEAICRALYPKKVVLVYNSYKDKAYEAILQVLRPVVERVEIIAVDDPRIEEYTKIEDAVKKTGCPCRTFKGVEDEGEYLVFGSFSVAEQFLKEYYGK